MATIKSFTDLEQSKKLAKILPIESADMYWDYDVQKHEHYPMIMDEQFDDLCIRCWSLAALLDIFPKIHGVKPILDLEENSIQYTGIDLYVVADNSVDACVAMIEKLHELKVL